tara:strand:- start:276 stop:506 length:231 start_codon:yes stop_codon:yes gene_type:complete
MANVIQSKRFVVRQSLVGKGTKIQVTFKNGNEVTYSHDKVYALLKDKLEAMACWAKYKSYTSSNNLPLSVRNEDIS